MLEQVNKLLKTAENVPSLQDCCIIRILQYYKGKIPQDFKSKVPENIFEKLEGAKLLRCCQTGKTFVAWKNPIFPLKGFRNMTQTEPYKQETWDVKNVHPNAPPLGQATLDYEQMIRVVCLSPNLKSIRKEEDEIFLEKFVKAHLLELYPLFEEEVDRDLPLVLDEMEKLGKIARFPSSNSSKSGPNSFTILEQEHQSIKLSNNWSTFKYNKHVYGWSKHCYNNKLFPSNAEGKLHCLMNRCCNLLAVKQHIESRSNQALFDGSDILYTLVEGTFSITWNDMKLIENVKVGDKWGTAAYDIDEV